MTSTAKIPSYLQSDPHDPTRPSPHLTRFLYGCSFALFTFADGTHHAHFKHDASVLILLRDRLLRLYRPTKREVEICHLLESDTVGKSQEMSKGARRRLEMVLNGCKLVAEGMHRDSRELERMPVEEAGVSQLRDQYC